MNRSSRASALTTVLDGVESAIRQRGQESNENLDWDSVMLTSSSGLKAASPGAEGLLWKPLKRSVENAILHVSYV